MIKQILLALPLAAGFLWAFSAQADSMRSECGFSNSAQERPETTSSCTFSQRQGFVSIRIDGGDDFEFSPVGDNPGNYHDQTGKTVYRLSGLGEEGQIFKLLGTHLFVFWYPSQLSCLGIQLSTPGQCDLIYNGLGFSVQASTGSSINQLRIQTSGLATDNSELSTELDGTAHRAELGDLDANGWPEVYVYVNSAGSGSYGSVVAYVVNGGKSISPIYLPSLDQVPEAFEGYMGHDEFALVENRLVRRFPVYADGDTNAAASGGTRQIQYQLVAGEAGWILEVDRIVEY
jgi:hypothetical protein